MKGRILISIEGINGTLSCSTQEEMREYIETMEKFDLIGELGLPAASELEVMPKAGRGRLFANID
jgi:predicted sulfurtransferase